MEIRSDWAIRQALAAERQKYGSMAAAALVNAVAVGLAGGVVAGTGATVASALMFAAAAALGLDGLCLAAISCRADGIWRFPALLFEAESVAAVVSAGSLVASAIVMTSVEADAVFEKALVGWGVFAAQAVEVVVSIMLAVLLWRGGRARRDAWRDAVYEAGV